jgi:S1-C subfamily serine protease
MRKSPELTVSAGSWWSAARRPPTIRRAFTTAVTVAAVTLALLFHAGGASAAAARAAVDSSGVVNVNTTLGYQQVSAAGTGMVLTSAGEVLTNNHVIRGATSIRVTDPTSGRSYPATVVGYSVTADIAVLRLKSASQLDTVTLGDSSKVRVGQTVSAIGNAGGIGGTPSATSGKVTGLGRTITAHDDNGRSEQLTGLIETDAALQPGNSGGPLVNRAGEVIGIDTAASSGFSFQETAGTGFAIPINRAIAIVKQIEAGRSSETVHIGSTAFLGVNVAASDDYSTPASGAVVVGVLQGSPAAAAGLGNGDVIVSLDGKSVSSPERLTSLLLRLTPGKTLRLAWVDESGYQHAAKVRAASGPPQ